MLHVFREAVVAIDALTDRELCAAVAIESIALIGKESNRLEEVEEQSVTDASDVYTEYPDPRRDEWATKWLPALRKATVGEACAETGISRAQMQRYRNKGARPRRDHLKRVVNFLERRAERA